MKLLIRLNVVFVITFPVVGWIAHAVCASLQQADARREVLTTAGLMLDSALASRAYTAEEIDPLLVTTCRMDSRPRASPSTRQRRLSPPYASCTPTSRTRKRR